MANGLAGVHGGLRQLERAAADTARLSAGAAQAPQVPVVAQVEARQRVESSARVLGVANETLGTLIDMTV